MVTFSTVNKTNFETKKKKGFGYFRHKIKSENKKNILYIKLSQNHHLVLLIMVVTNPDTNYHSVFFNSFKMIRNSRSVRKFIFSGDDFRIIFSKSMKSQFASLPSGSMTVFCLMRSLNCQIIPFGYYSSSGLYASQ